MKTYICFIRHGETSWNKEGRIQGLIDNLLSDNGVNEAKVLASNLKEIDPRWDIIVTSPLTRAKQTALIIKEGLNIDIPLIIEDNLTERNFGEAEGVIISKDLFSRILNDDITGLEKSIHLQNRVHEATIKIAKENPGKKILIVAHSHVIKALLIKLDNKYTYKQQVKNLSLNKFVYQFDKLLIDEINININKKDI